MMQDTVMVVDVGGVVDVLRLSDDGEGDDDDGGSCPDQPRFTPDQERVSQKLLTCSYESTSLKLPALLGKILQ